MGALEKNNVMLIEEFPLVIIGLLDDDLCIQSLWLLKQQVDISNCFKNKIKYILLQRSATMQVLRLCCSTLTFQNVKSEMSG